MLRRAASHAIRLVRSLPCSTLPATPRSFTTLPTIISRASPLRTLLLPAAPLLFVSAAAAVAYAQPAPPALPPPVPTPPARPKAPLLALALENWPSLCTVAVLTLLSTLLKLLVTKRMGALYDLTKKAAGSLPLRPLVTVLGLRLTEGLLRATQAWAWARAAARIEASLLARAYSSLLRTDLAALQCSAHLSEDVSETTRALETLAFKGVRNASTVLLGAASLALQSPDMACVALAMVPVATGLFVAVGTWSSVLSRRAQSAQHAASALSAERLSNVRTVRSFVQESAEEARFEAALDAACAKKDAHARVHALHTGLLAALPGMGMGLWLYYGAQLVSGGSLTVGALTTVIPLIMEVATSLGGLSRLHTSLVRGVDAAARLEALDAAPSHIESTQGAALSDIEGALAFHNVRFTYPGRNAPALDDFSLSLAPGESFALVGASGGGKSTVAALLHRLYDPQEGAITLDGVDLRLLNPHQLRRSIGSVAQEPVLFAGSVRDNISYAEPGASDADVETAARRANAHDFITALPHGYDTPVGERGAQLSGGQRQRISLARTLLAQPAILLLDEATSALDSESERLVSQATQAAMQGRTVLVIAHRLSTVRSLDRIGVVAGGKLVEVGTHESLLAKRGAYWRLVQSAELMNDARSKSRHGGGG